MSFVINEKGEFRMFDNNKRKIVVVEQKLEMLQYFLSLIQKRFLEKFEEFNIQTRAS